MEKQRASVLETFSRKGGHEGLITLLWIHLLNRVLIAIAMGLNDAHEQPSLNIYKRGCVF